MNPKETIRQHLAAADLEAALAVWQNNIAHSDPLRYDLTLLSGRLAELKIQEQHGTLSFAEANIPRNKIALAIGEKLQAWQPGGDQEALYRAIDQLPFIPGSDLGPLFLVNCDRKKAQKRFKNTLDACKGDAKNELPRRPFQFYFITGCPTQMPGSLSKRLVLQLIEDEFPETAAALHAPAQSAAERVDFPFDETDLGRVKIEKLPLGADPKASERKFKAYMQRRFHLGEGQTLEAFIETGVPQLKYDYVATLFELPESEWEADEGEICRYLQWMVDTFQKPHPDAPVFLFFIAVRFKNFHEESARTPQQRAALNQLEQLCTDNATAIIRELDPIEPQHLEDWLMEAGISNPNDAQTLLRALAQGLHPPDRAFYEQSQRLHMKDVEPVQRLIYEKLRKKRELTN